jgi:hypothetical protein
LNEISKSSERVFNVKAWSERFQKAKKKKNNQQKEIAVILLLGKSKSQVFFGPIRLAIGSS